MEFSVVPASQLEFEALVAGFNKGYEGYIVPIHLNAEQLRAHLLNYDIDLDASRTAVVGSEVIGIALLGRRESRGWVGGVGVSPTYRNRGTGRQLMGALLEAARQQGLTTVQLEVIVGNDAAYHLYQTLGFKTLRRLLIVERPPAPIAGETQFSVEPISPVEALAHYQRLHSSPNPWQRERESLLNSAGKLSGWVVNQDGHPSAYGIGIAQSDRIQWFDLAATNEDALKELVVHIHTLHPDAPARLINLAEDDRAWQVLSPLGYREGMSQWEMQLAL